MAKLSQVVHCFLYSHNRRWQVHDDGPPPDPRCGAMAAWNSTTQPSEQIYFPPVGCLLCVCCRTRPNVWKEENGKYLPQSRLHLREQRPKRGKREESLSADIISVLNRLLSVSRRHVLPPVAVAHCGACSFDAVFHCFVPSGLLLHSASLWNHNDGVTR